MILRFDCRHAQGHAPALLADARHRAAHKRRQQYEVRFATQAGSVATLEGPVPVAAGDAVVTGSAGEQWPVARARFGAKYRPLPPLPFGRDGRYESLPLPVLVLQPGQPFEVELADGRARLHGQAGDWLVDYGDGSLGVVAAALFDAMYEFDT